jgi:hypothetical protein
MVASTTSGNPTGSVALKDTVSGVTSTLGTPALSQGTASYATSTLALGTHSITAVYAGDTNFLTSSSAAQTITVVAPVALSLTPASLSLAAGANGMSIVTVTPVGSFTGLVALNCSSPVSYVECPAITSVMLSGTSPASATITMSVASTYGRLAPGGRESDGSVYALLLPFGALLLLPLRRQAFVVRVVPLLVLGVVFGMTACGGGGSSSSGGSLPPAGAQSVTITGTANSVPVTATLTVNVTN